MKVSLLRPPYYEISQPKKRATLGNPVYDGALLFREIFAVFADDASFL